MNCSAITKQNKQCRRRAAAGNYCSQHGCGVFSDARDFIKRRVTALREGPSSKPSGRLQSFMNDNQNCIVQLRVGRRPILSPLHRTLDAISFGRFSKKAKELNYDQVFHNYILVTLDDGRVVKIEKNEIVSESKSSAKDLEGQLFDVPLGGKQLSIKELIDNASKNDEQNFYRYRASTNNCQKFTQDIIVRNGLIEPYVPQDAAQLIDTLPAKAVIPNLITDAAAVANRLLMGDGLNVQKKIKLRRKQKIVSSL